jgi:hypothetical protein
MQILYYYYYFFSFPDLFDDVPGSRNKRKLSSVGAVNKRKKVESGLNHRTKTEMNPRIQNNFGKRKQKLQRDSVHRRKMFGSKISMKNKKQ